MRARLVRGHLSFRMISLFDIRFYFDMPESDLHLQLKRVACRWLWSHGYAAVGDEVEVPGVGIIDVAAAGKWKPYNPRRAVFQREPVVDRHHVGGRAPHFSLKTSR